MKSTKINIFCFVCVLLDVIVIQTSRNNYLSFVYAKDLNIFFHSRLLFFSLFFYVFFNKTEQSVYFSFIFSQYFWFKSTQMYLYVGNVYMWTRDAVGRLWTGANEIATFFFVVSFQFSADIIVWNASMSAQVVNNNYYYHF